MSEVAGNEAGPDPLDDRLMAFADRMERAGQVEGAEGIRSSLASIRETWRGADQWESIVEDVERVSEAAASIAETLRKYLDLEEA